MLAPPANRPRIHGVPPILQAMSPPALQLLQDASSYVMYLAGHGGPVESWAPFLPAIETFQSHFREWITSENMTLADIHASIPITPDLVYWRPQTDTFLKNCEEGHAHDLPPVIAQVVMLATQWRILKDNTPGIHDVIDSWEQVRYLSRMGLSSWTHSGAP